VATAEDDQAFLQRSYIQLQTDPANAADGQKKEFLETMKKLGILSTPSKVRLLSISLVPLPIHSPYISLQKLDPCS